MIVQQSAEQRLDAALRRVHAAIDLRCAIERERSRMEFVLLRASLVARFASISGAIFALSLARQFPRLP